MTYQIGDIIPHVPPRGLTGAPMAHIAWHALQVAPQREKAVSEALRRSHGISFAFYPVRTVPKVRNGKKVTVERPQVSRYVFARFTCWPNWDVMRNRRLITGVVCDGLFPKLISPDAIRTLQGLPTRAEQQAQAEYDRLYKLQAGDHAQTMDGPLSDLRVEITDVRADGYEWVFGSVRGFTQAGKIRRVE